MDTSDSLLSRSGTAFLHTTRVFPEEKTDRTLSCVRPERSQVDDLAYRGLSKPMLP